tara:strand:- start:30 stop:200 length:171 start_codon:yes stop_codon:yes gene_type:complete
MFCFCGIISSVVPLKVYLFVWFFLEEYMGGDILTEEDIKNYKKTKAIIKKMLSSAI